MDKLTEGVQNEVLRASCSEILLSSVETTNKSFVNSSGKRSFRNMRTHSWNTIEYIDHKLSQCRSSCREATEIRGYENLTSIIHSHGNNWRLRF